MQRLVVYYPEYAEKLALKLLGREIYDPDLVRNFVGNELVEAGDEKTWRELVEKFESQHGKAVSQTIPYWIHWTCWDTDFEESDESLQEREIAARILRSNYPNYNVSEPPAFGVVELNDQISIVRSVANLKTEKIDNAVHSTFLDALSTESRPTIYEVEKLAELAVVRVKDSTKKKIYAEYFRRRIKEVNVRIASIENDPSLVERLQNKIAALEQFAKTAER